MLALLVAGVLLLARAHQSYPRDVATAMASLRSTPARSTAKQHH